MSKLEKLEALSEAATPGPWYFLSTSKAQDSALQCGVILATMDRIISEIGNSSIGKPLNVEDAANAQLIAAFNPKVVKELLGLIKGARAVIVAQADHVIYEHPEDAEDCGIRACCSVASFRPHLPSCDTQGILEKIRKFDEGTCNERD
jgi:hypothetical protein